MSLHLTSQFARLSTWQRPLRIVSSSHTRGYISGLTTSRLLASTHAVPTPSSSRPRACSPTFLQQSRRSYASEVYSPSTIGIGNLKPAQPKKNRKRVGRGSSSGRGGTSTRGHKGQKARSGNGKPTPGFEGGQTPLMRRYPKRGFTNIHARQYVPVNIGRIQEWIDQGRLDPTQPITARELYDSNCIHDFGEGVKVLGDGAEELRQPINLVVSKASYSAIHAIEAAGGSIETKYYTELTLRALVKPHKFEGKILPRDADPSSRRELVYYSNAANRGYLSKRKPSPVPKATKIDPIEEATNISSSP